ncbi:MAG: transcriptional repressor, LexA family [Verrucomicrobiales bacterium]|nr:transcriptional repressor, LexA family [Verrucomicrobiales bacterium]
MVTLTQRQKQILDYIYRSQQAEGITPSFRDIAREFGFRSMTSAIDHVSALKKKGVLATRPNRARSLQVISPLQKLRKRVVDIPLFGSIPAGFAQDRLQEAQGCISIDVQSLGYKPTSRTFALQVRGDSMIGRHILDGDNVILEHGVTPRNGDVVAALIDNESTLKTYIQEKGKPYLRAENPRYPALIPAQELVIQGVMVALLRKRK